MTGPAPDPLDPPEATQAAVATAAAADVVVRDLHRLEHLRAAQRLFEDVWRPGEGEPSPMTVGLLRALAHAGGYVAGAFDGSRAWSGPALGFFAAPPASPALHSHITGSPWRPAPASASRSSCTSARGAWPAGSTRSCGPSTRW